MRMKGKKVIFSKRDTWNLDNVLASVISEGLKKFKEELEQDDFQGFPVEMYQELGINPENPTDEDSENAMQLWFDKIDRMIYAFNLDNEPKISDYDFKVKFIEESRTAIGVKGHMEVDNEIEEKRYIQDLKMYNEKCEQGRMLFSKYFNNLWI